MPIPFRPLPDDEPPLTLPEFLRRLEGEPEFVAKMRAHYEAALALPLSPDTEALHAAASKALRTLKHHQGLVGAKRKIVQAFGLLELEEIEGLPEETYAECERLLDEARDDALDVLEPERTSLMTKIAGVQEALTELRKME